MNQKRENKILDIVTTIVKAAKSKKEIDEPKFVMEICARYGCTERKAKEYINVAQFRIDNKLS